MIRQLNLQHPQAPTPQRNPSSPSRHLRSNPSPKNYLAIANDDLLYGFRKRSQPTRPRQNPWTGWCSKHLHRHSFGQIISGLAQLAISFSMMMRCKQKAIFAQYEGWRKTTDG